MWRVVMVGVVALMLTAGCSTRRNPAKCDSNAECEAPLSFCDVNGEFEESGFEPNTCTVRPDGCPLERCGCDPGVALKCDVDQLTMCNPDGASTSTLTCGLGCSTAEPRCLTFEPSNGLGPALAMAAAEPDVILPLNARIDTDLGLIQDSSGATHDVRSLVITQDGGTKIRAFLARSFVIDAAVAQGSHALAFVSAGSITLRGQLDGSAQTKRHGPGGLDAPAACAGEHGQFIASSNTKGSAGAGAGNATIGGIGGAENLPGRTGGAAVPGTSPLVGGCRGGHYLNADGMAPMGSGGGGGGAVQLVSLDEIALVNLGFIHVGGGGGEAHGGGGSGGTVVLEAPRVRITGATAGVATNGGAGGGCQAGRDATADTIAATTPVCGSNVAGKGATGSVAPGPGSFACGVGGPCFYVEDHPGGGGGAAGRLHISTVSGAVEMTGGPVLSAHVTTSTLTPR